ncbi:MAG: MFS transporter, partial [Acidimicrobiales bacterium]
MPRQPPTGSSVAPLHRNRDFVLFWSSQTLSTTGTRASSIAYPLLVLAMTGSAAKAGTVGFAQTLPFLLWFLPAGAFVDRLDRKRIMIIAELVRFGAMGSVAVALVLDGFNLTHILIVAFIEGSALVFFEVAEAAALPHIVPAEQLPTALAQNQARQQAAELWGQPLGGFLFSIGRSVPFAFDALTYLVSFAALAVIKPAFQHRRPTASKSMMSDIGDGVTWLWNQPFLRSLTGLVAVSNFVISALVLTVIVKAQGLGASPTVVGFV